MSKQRSKSERASALRLKISQMQNELKRIENQAKEDERKARTKRLCQRAGLLEKILPDTIALDDKRFELFVKNHIANSYGKTALHKLKAEQEKESSADETPFVEQSTATETEDVQSSTVPINPKYIED